MSSNICIDQSYRSSQNVKNALETIDEKCGSPEESSLKISFPELSNEVFSSENSSSFLFMPYKIISTMMKAWEKFN